MGVQRRKRKLREVLTSPFQILTNNPLVAENYSERFPVQFFPDGSDRDVLLRARDLVHNGHRILTAPLSGSVKPWETPYRSIMVTSAHDDAVDAFSLDIMERALAIISHSKRGPETIAESILHDFQIIDLSLIDSALPSAEAIGVYRIPGKETEVKR